MDALTVPIPLPRYKLDAALGRIPRQHSITKVREDTVGRETASWVCILAAAPLAAAGFFQYNSLTLEAFLWAVIKSQLLCAAPRKFEAGNIYQDALHDKEKYDHD